MDWFFWIFNSFSIAAQSCLQMFFAGRFSEKKIKPLYFAVYFLPLYSTILFHSDLLVICVEFLALYAVNRFLLKNNQPISCVTTVLAIYVPWLSYGVINSLSFLLFPNVPAQIIWGYVFAWLTLLVSFAVCFCCYQFISNRLSLDDKRQEALVWMLLPPGLFLSAVEFYIFNNDYSNVVVIPTPTDTGRHLALLTLHLLGFGALFCTLYAYKRTCDGFRAQTALASLRQETEAQKTYVAQAQMRYEQTKSFRHDIKNHLSVLDGLLKNKNYSQAQSYLQKLEAVTNELSFPVHTGNPVVDVLLGDKLELARASKTEIEISLTLPKLCGVNDLDLCVIFSNALDNALQACLKTKGPKWIRVTGEQQGDFYMLQFENSCSTPSELTAGTGLSNIKAVAEKYKGAITFEKTASLFRLNLLLNLS